ncbi:branched-chain amino acid ABC transporter permease [Epidermidibacterium keratini]|uniref:branched-chain amino acid ABC transporter permease n=1 Tax=Epidermidibacterium keratini TaxID=1891644 RepID=UPI001CEF639D|nr:branched-chain amino acid ABC transporter permease [Epidermidibacterium keratini]
MILASSSAILAADWISFDYEKLFRNFASYTFGGLTVGAIYALIAIGYTLVYGVLRLINFAHSEVFLVGLFAQYFALQAMGFTPNADTYDEGIALTIVYLFAAMLVAMLASGGTALLVERVAYRRLRKMGAPPFVFLITAIGASFVLQQIFFVWRGGVPEPPIKLVSPEVQFSIFGADVDNRQLVIVGAAVVMMIIADIFVNRTKLGRGIRAVSQDETTATLMGVNPQRVIMITFLFGGVLAGAAALLYSLYVPQTLVFNAGFLLGLKAFAAAVLGGIGNLRGALLGGLLLGVAESWGSALIGDQWKHAIAFILLIFILMFRPTGILGESLGKARV